MLRAVRVSPPVTFPVSVAEARDHCRVTDNGEDALLQSYVEAATAHLDGISGVLGRCIVDQVWRQDFHDWSSLRLPFPDVKAVAVVWRDAIGTPTTVASGDYWLEVTDAGTILRFVSGWVSPSLPSNVAAPISVTFTAGYGSFVPPGIKLAILLMVAHWYSNREGVITGVTSKPIEFALESLISQHRIWAAA